MVVFIVEGDVELAGKLLKLVMWKARSCWRIHSYSSMESHNLHSGCGELKDFPKLNKTCGMFD